LQQNTTILKLYFVCYGILGIGTIIFLVLNAFHLIEWNKEKHDSWMAYFLATAFTGDLNSERSSCFKYNAFSLQIGIYAYTLAVLYFYISYLNDDEL